MPPGLTSPVHLLIILAVAFVVLGPEQLPGAVRQAGRFLAEVRRWSESLRAEIDSALRVDAESTSGTTGLSGVPPDGSTSPNNATKEQP